MKIKKIFLSLLVFILLFSFTACDFHWSSILKKDEPVEEETKKTILTTPTTAAAEASATPTSTPAPSSKTNSVQILYQGEEIKSISQMTSSVLQLTGEIEDGSKGTWTSSDSSVAAVDQNGIVSCLKVGNTTISYGNDEISAELALEVKEPTITVFYNGTVANNDISLSNTWGTELTFTATADPEGEITWSSDDVTVATVEDGHVVAHHTGVTTVWAKCGTAKQGIIVRVLDNPNNPYSTSEDENEPTITITFRGVVNHDFTLAVGESVNMSYETSNMIISDEKAVWSMADESIATVDQNGNVTGVKKGATTLYVQIGDVKDASDVHVN